MAERNPVKPGKPAKREKTAKPRQAARPDAAPAPKAGKTAAAGSVATGSRRKSESKPTSPSKPKIQPKSKLKAGPRVSAAAKRPAAAGRLAALAPERVAELLRRLHAEYGDARCALDHSSAWELLVATILSAQCTDARVNQVTPRLFAEYPTPQAMAAAPIEALESLIRTTGFYHNKAKSIQGAGRVISRDFGGRVPQTMEELLTVPGAARKTANVVLGVAFGKAEGVVVDTHVFRIARRLGLARGETPQKVEQELMKVIPREHWIGFSHELIHHGRAVCVARRPRCADCLLEKLCSAPDKSWHSGAMDPAGN